MSKSQYPIKSQCQNPNVKIGYLDFRFWISARRRGSVLLLAMLILSSVLAASTAVGTLVVREIRANRQLDDAVIAYYAAESATEKGLWLETLPDSTLLGLQQTEQSLVTGSTTKIARQATRKDTKIIIPLIPKGKNIIVDLYKPDSYVDGDVTGDLGAGVDTLTVVKSGGALTVACQARRGGPTGQTAVTCPAELSQTMNTDTWIPTLDSSLAYRFTLTAGATEDVRNITFSGKLSDNDVFLPTPLTILGKGTLPSSSQGVGASLVTGSPFDIASP